MTTTQIFRKPNKQNNKKEYLQLFLFTENIFFIVKWTFSPSLLVLPSSLSPWVNINSVRHLNVHKTHIINLARFYATEAPAASEALRLTFVVPHKVNHSRPQHINYPTYQQIHLTCIKFLRRLSTRPLMSNKSTWLPPLVIWVFSLTTFLPLNNWTLVSLKLLRPLNSPRNSLVKK